LIGGTDLFPEAMSRLEAKPEPEGLGLDVAKAKRYNGKSKKCTLDTPKS
jgi:hypothetical protein